MRAVLKCLSRIIELLQLRATDYLTIDHAAAVCDLRDGRIIRNAIRAGELPAANICRGRDKKIWRVARRDLDRWIRSRITGPNAHRP